MTRPDEMTRDLALLDELLSRAGHDFSRTFRVVLKDQDWLVEAIPSHMKQPETSRAPGLASLSLAAGLAPALPGNMQDLVPPPPALVTRVDATTPGSTGPDSGWDLVAPVETFPSGENKVRPDVPPVRPVAPPPIQATVHEMPVAPPAIQASRNEKPAALPPARAARPASLPGHPTLSAPSPVEPAGRVGPDWPDLMTSWQDPRLSGPLMPAEPRHANKDSVAHRTESAHGHPARQTLAHATLPETPARALGEVEGTVAADAAPRPRWHVIRRGETLIQLARRFYDGKGRHWMALFEANKDHLASPHKVFPGDRILVPTQDEIAERERVRKGTKATGIAADMRRRRTRLS